MMPPDPPRFPILVDPARAGIISLLLRCERKP